MARFDGLRPDADRVWGTMDAPRMVAHLCDQMRHTLGDAEVAARPGPPRWPGMKYAIIYLLPWPKGKIKGPEEAFMTPPGPWGDDIATLRGLVQRFVEDEARTSWPDHALFGPMSRRLWGAFCYRHFDHHLRQFGA